MVTIWFAGLVWIVRHGSTGTQPTEIWKASTDLSSGHQIKRGDLDVGDPLLIDLQVAKESSILNRHTIRDLRAGDEVREDDLRDFPSLIPRSGEHFAWFAELGQDQRLLAQLLQPGDRVSLCFDEGAAASLRLTCVSPCVPVLAVHAARDDKDISWLAVQIEDRMQQFLGKYLRASHKVILRSNHVH
jgi:hypothetical protein